MKLHAKIIKRRTGKSKGKWIVRIEYFDELTGRTRFVERHADKRSDAVDKRTELVRDIEKTQGQSLNGERMTFAQLADIAKKTFYKKAVIVEGRKLPNTVRSLSTINFQLDRLIPFFGKRLIRQITNESLQDYRDHRLKEGSKHPTARDEWRPVKLATINRELSTMRRMMGYAYEKGWLVRELSFKHAIDTDAERPRSRILSVEEEAKLLAACQGEREVPYERTRHGKVEQITATHTLDNPRLKAAILLAVDGGMRRKEILKLNWDQIDFTKNWIKILGTHTKTEQERLAPFSSRAKTELLKIRELDPNGPPFPFADFKRSWATAKRLAGLTDLHFHDLRRSATTRWTEQGVPLAFVGKAAGHAQLQTTQRHYITADEEVIGAIAAGMDSLQKGEIQSVGKAPN